MMKRIFIAFFLVLAFHSPALAFWMWTPETNNWVNPKYSVKETPREQLAHALEAYNEGDLKKATTELRKLIKHYPRAREAAEAQYYIALCREKNGELLKAFNEYQIAIEKYPFSERSADIVKRQYDIGNRMLDGEGKKSAFVNAIVGGDYDVIEVFRTVIKNVPYGEFAGQAQYKIGLYLQEKQMYQEARDEFEKTINDYPETEWAKAARYQIALADAKRSSEAQYDQRVTKAAIKEFEYFIKDYPDARLSQAAKSQIQKLREKEAENAFLVAVFYEKQKKYTAAKMYYTNVVEEYKNTSWASKALESIRKLNATKK